MKVRSGAKRAVAGVAAVALVATLAACTPDDRVVAGSSVAVAVSGTFTSLNPNSSFGRASELNADIASLTSTGFAYADDSYGVVRDESFGTAEIVSDDPFVVRYTLADELHWSDGVPVTGADLLLAWAANSQALDTPDVVVDDLVDAETGRLGELPDGVVHFDGAIGRGLELATTIPDLSKDGRALTVTFDSFTPGWLTALAPSLPAHVVASRALELPLHEAGEAAEPGTGADTDAPAEPDLQLAAAAAGTLTEAILEHDDTALSAIASVWNSGFDLTGAAPDPELLVASGPYRVTEVADGRVTLTVNPHYRGMRAPTIETITLSTVQDPTVLTEKLRSGDIDIATPAPDAELAAELADIPGVVVSAGSESTFEHLDLQLTGSKSGLFGDARIREAFLLVVPRQGIVDELVTPVQADAAVLDSFVLRPGADGYDDAIAVNGSERFRSTDVAAAKTLLAEAGVVAPEVCILFDPADERRRTEFTLIQTSAARAGFVVTDCSRADWRGLLGVAGAYDASLFAWDSTRLGPGAVAAVFRSDSAVANLNGFSDPAADALIDRITASDDPAVQTQALTELDTILWASGYGVPLFAHPTLTVVSERVEGVTRSPLARGVLWNAWEWSPAQEPGGAETSGPLG